MEGKTIKSYLILLFSLFLIFGCAGSSDNEEDFLDEDAQNQKELDDIEALLGIQSDNSQQQPQQKKPSEGEKLDLLESDALIDNSQPAPVTNAEKDKLETKIKQLENEIRQKDMTIADLNAKVSTQQNQLEQRPAPSGSSTNTIVSDISIEEYQYRYDDARSEFENRNYQAAISLFESLLSASATHSLSDNAQYWIGECHYALGHYDSAIIDFEKVFTFPKSNKLDDAQYKLGLCYIRKGDQTKAREELNRFLANYPQSNLVQKAENLLSSM